MEKIEFINYIKTSKIEELNLLLNTTRCSYYSYNSYILLENEIEELIKEINIEKYLLLADFYLIPLINENIVSIIFNKFIKEDKEDKLKEIVFNSAYRNFIFEEDNYKEENYTNLFKERFKIIFKISEIKELLENIKNKELRDILIDNKKQTETEIKELLEKKKDLINKVKELRKIKTILIKNKEELINKENEKKFLKEINKLENGFIEVSKIKTKLFKSKIIYSFLLQSEHFYIKTKNYNIKDFSDKEDLRHIIETGFLEDIKKEEIMLKKELKELLKEKKKFL